ncbi:uncharacterized protein LOC110855976 isoform X2 [Folsomia candida]|nr:uncharacterized protein LOC110855976 isoform X2 [Folsomia candida]
MSIPRTRGTSASPSNHQFVYASDRKARTLGAKSVLKSSGSGIEEASIDNGTTNAKNAAREADRLNNILGNLSIKFKCCTFTYKDAHLLAVKKTKEKSTWKKWKANSKTTLKRFGEVLGVEESEFKSCIYIPKSEEDQVQQFVRKNFSDSRIKFESCRFVKRGSTFFEKVAQRLRGVFGIIFELTYPDSSAVVEEYNFRLKDISVITTYVQERIVEKG